MVSWSGEVKENPQRFREAHEAQSDPPQTTDTVLAAAMNKIRAIINVGVVSTSRLGVEQMLCVRVTDGLQVCLTHSVCLVHTAERDVLRKRRLAR